MFLRSHDLAPKHKKPGGDDPPGSSPLTRKVLYGIRLMMSGYEDPQSAANGAERHFHDLVTRHRQSDFVLPDLFRHQNLVDDVHNAVFRLQVGLSDFGVANVNDVPLFRDLQ